MTCKVLAVLPTNNHRLTETWQNRPVKEQIHSSKMTYFCQKLEIPAILKVTMTHAHARAWKLEDFLIYLVDYTHAATIRTDWRQEVFMLPSIYL